MQTISHLYPKVTKQQYIRWTSTEDFLRKIYGKEKVEKEIAKE